MMRLYNTATRKIEEFIPIHKDKVGMYTCGPTVYDFTHLGHLRTYTMNDVLVRTLKHAGYQVTFIENITDVGHLSSDGDTGEDKLEKGAKKYQQTVWDIAQKFTNYFFRSMDLMGNLRPSKSTKATDHIQEQLEMVKVLEAKGYTYVIKNDGVYFDTSKFADYGKMARLKLDQQQEGARVERVKDKRNPADFALWKFEREGENRAMSWQSPWAERSFPGWHVECSAMSRKYLGDQFDIHAGGVDHIPVHHTNEIAQTEAVIGKKPSVKYWVHFNFLQVDGQKMSKSLGNFYTIDDVLNKSFLPRALRLLFLTAHYQSELNFTWQSLAGVQKSYLKLLKLVAQLQQKSNQSKDLVISDHKYYQKFFGYLENNLDTPKAVSVLWQVANDEKLDDEVKLALLYSFDEILQLQLKQAKEVLEGIKGDSEVTLTTEVKELLKQRQQARIDKDWKKADSLRELLLTKGYRVKDSEDGQEVIKN